MADYANSTDLGYLITALSSDVSSNLKSYAMEVSTTWVNSKVEGLSTSSVPDLVEKAATYYAYVFILKNLYDTTGEESPMMDWYEKQANELLGAYVAQHATEESEIHPYSSNQSPTHTYTERNLRTTIDSDDDIYYVDEDVWQSEG